MSDLFERCASFINKRLVENFIKGGAFDCFNRTRADMLQWYSDELNDVVERNKKHSTGQISIFDMMPELKTTATTEREQVKELPKQVLYNFENEVLGLYMTGSPLDDYDDIAKRFRFDFDTSETMAYVPDGSEDGEAVRPEVKKRFVTTGGILRDIRVVVGRDNNRMGFGVMEDKYDSIEVALYGATYEKYKTLFGADAFVVIKGNVVESRDGYKINIREIINPRNDEKQKDEQVTEQTTTTTLWLKMESRDDEVYAKIKDVLDQYEGDIPVKIKIEGKAYGMETTVRRCSGIEYELSLLLGDKNVIFFEK